MLFMSFTLLRLCWETHYPYEHIPGTAALPGQSLWAANTTSLLLLFATLNISEKRKVKNSVAPVLSFQAIIDIIRWMTYK